jgi:hypothetical protein
MASRKRSKVGTYARRAYGFGGFLHQKPVNDALRGAGAARIVERLENMVGQPQEPIRSALALGAGLLAGGIIGGGVAALTSTNIIEMITGMGQTQGTTDITSGGL